MKENDYKENEKIIEKNVGLPRALRSIAWGEWFCKEYSDGISENEKVEKGQSIGTVGNTASFESEMEGHLHFELLKDGEYMDPAIYIK